MKEIIIITLFLASCSTSGIQKELQLEIDNDTLSREALYWGAIDSVVYKKDSIIIYNSRMDTVIMASGIFSYLKFDHLVYSATSRLVYHSVKKAEFYSSIGDSNKAKKFHQIVVEHYKNDWKSSTVGETWSDLGTVFSHKVNTSILISYSLENLGYLDEAIDVLSPFLANSETFGTKIHYRFIDLCIKKHGIDAVKQEIKNSPTTVFLREQNAPESDDWRILIFGAEIGVGKLYKQEKLTQDQALDALKKTDIYKLIE